MVSIYSYLLLHWVCVGVRERESTTVCVIRGQHAGAGSLLYHVGSRNRTQIIRFRSQHVCYLSFQPTPVFIILRWCEFIFPYSQIKLHCVCTLHFLCVFVSWWTPRLILSHGHFEHSYNKNACARIFLECLLDINSGVVQLSSVV